LNAVRNAECCAWYAPCHELVETFGVIVNYKKEES
jgi:hypothetical protein